MAVQEALYFENLGPSSISGMLNPFPVIDVDDFPVNFQTPPTQCISLNQTTPTPPPPAVPQDQVFSMAFSETLGKENQEIDNLLYLHNKRLRSAFQEQRKQHLSILLNKLESKALPLMMQKDEELSQARKKTMELQDCLRKVETERESWQRLTEEKEHMVVNLHNMLNQARERLILNSTIDDAQSSCGSCERKEQEVETGSKKMGCKRCSSGRACIVFLPCRHLCSCKCCESLLGSCPVCNSAKQATVEVFLG